MKGGWFIGNFTPSVLKAKNFEVAVKSYKAGDKEPRHFHLLAEEITLVISGTVNFNTNTYSSGQIVLIEKGERVTFEAITDAITVVVKSPSITNDKYIEEL